MGSQGNLCEDVHPSGSLEPLMRLTAENDGNHNVLDELSYNPDIPTTNWTYNSLSSMPNKNVTVPLSSGIYGQQLQPSSLGTEQNLNNDNICTQSCRAIVTTTQQQYHGLYNINSTSGTCPQQCLPYMYPSSSTNPQCNISHRPRLQFPSSSSRYGPSSSFNSLFLNNLTPRRPFFNSSIHQRRRPQRQSNQCLERGESSSVSQRQLQPSFLGTEENLNNYHLPTQNCHAIQQQHQQGRNFHVQPNNQGLYNQMMMDSAPRRSEALTGVNQQLNERTTSLEEPNIPTMQQYQQQFSRRYDPNSTFGEYSGTQGLIDQRSSSFKSPCLKKQTHIRPFTNPSILLQQLQPSFLGTEENLNNYHLPTQNFHAVQQQHQQGRNFHVQPNNQGLYNQMMMDSGPRRSEALTGVNQQLNARTTSLEEPNIPTMESGGHINGQSSTHHLATDTLRRRRPQSNECEFGESSSSAKRMRIISPGENNESFADSLLNLREERTTNSVLSPTYRTSGLTVNPHLRRSDDIRSPYGPYDERYEADRQYLDPHMRKFENSVRRGN
ncbi:BnaA09g30580D [Brassica napus]|uniref:BnaA09g30580D protein n=1 Tax=Brassica napus TaxID=3708 RepID=A0A078G7I3_BRANA|nr:BnaA09g30580D [Brassica napus]